MKSQLIRWSATLGLVGSTLVGTWFGSALQALALPQDQILQKLNEIPVFVVGNEKGVFLASGENNKKILVSYLSQQDAQKTVDQLVKTNPNTKVQVVPLPLGEVYKITKDKKGTPEQPDLFEFVPLNGQIQPALTLLQQQDPKAKEFPGVPVFYAIIKKDKQEIPLTFTNGDKNQTPFFFEKESLVSLVDRVKKEQPDIAKSLEIKVAALGNIIAALENSDDEFTRSIVLVRSRESSEFVQKLQTQQPNQSKPANSSNPANTTPATPKK